MRFHSYSYQTLPSTPDGRVLGELTLAHICDNSGGGASAYIRNCDDLEVAYHLIYEGTDMSLDTTPPPPGLASVGNDAVKHATHCVS